MADRNRYQDRYRRERGEDEGFFERVKDWFNREVRNENRDDDRDYRNYGRGYRGESRDDYRQSSWRDRDNLRPWRAGQGQDWDDSARGSRMYRHSQDQDENNQVRGYDRGYGNFFGSEYGSRYNRDRDFGRSGGRGYDRDQYNAYRPLGWDYEDSDEDWEYDRPYPTAGMRSDFDESGSRRGYNRDRSGRRYDYERDYGDYVGYESEGAFYQDLDNPYTSEYWEVWVVPGEFTGYGPSDYRRSDERILDDVCERLTRHGRLDASEIEVNVQDGAVTLTGSVPDRTMKRMAEDTAETVNGVQDVRNEIRVTHREGDRFRSYGADSQRGQQSRGGYRDHERGYGRGQVVDRDYNNQQDWSTANVETGESSTRDSTAAVTQPVTDKRLQVRQDMEVIGSDGKVIGRVKEIRGSDFLVDREMARDVYVPHGSVESVGAQVLLRIKHDEVDNQGWEMPDILGS